MLIDLTNTNKKAIIDDKNYARVSQFKWFLKEVGPDSFYVARSIHKNGKTSTIYLHRFIMQPQAEQDVHHKDENTLNNIEENLEKREAILHRCYHFSKYRSTSKQRPFS